MSTDFQKLTEIVSSDVVLKAIEVSKRLTEMGIPHALIGGLAVGIHGHPRATKDVDYLVGKEAFQKEIPIMLFRDELIELVEQGKVDLLSVPTEFPELQEALILPEENTIPIIPLEALVVLKLSANRPQDRADILSLINGGADISDIALYLKKHAPSLINLFAELISNNNC